MRYMYYLDDNIIIIIIFLNKLLTNQPGFHHLIFISLLPTI